MERNSFIFYRDWSDAISGLPEEVRLEVYDAIIAYALSGKLSELKPMAMVAFVFIKRTIDRDTAKYMSISEKRSISGKKGAAKRSNCQQLPAIASKYPHNDNDNVNDNVNVNENENENENDFHTREEKILKNSDFQGVKESEIFQISDLKKLAGDYWLETAGMKLHVTPEKLKTFFDEFCDIQELSGYTNTINDFRRHFVNWLNIKLKDTKKGLVNDDGGDWTGKMLEKFKNKQNGSK